MILSERVENSCCRAETSKKELMSDVVILCGMLRKDLFGMKKERRKQLSYVLLMHLLPYTMKLPATRKGNAKTNTV